MASRLEREVKKPFPSIEVKYNIQSKSVTISSEIKSDVEDAKKEFDAYDKKVHKVELRDLSEGMKDLLLRQHISEYVANTFKLRYLLFMREEDGKFVCVGQYLGDGKKLVEIMKKCILSTSIWKNFLQMDYGRDLLNKFADSIVQENDSRKNISHICHTADLQDEINSFIEKCIMRDYYRKKCNPATSEFLQIPNWSIVSKVEEKYNMKIGFEMEHIVFYGDYSLGEQASKELERNIPHDEIILRNADRYKSLLESEEGQKTMNEISKGKNCCWTMTCQTDSKAGKLVKVMMNGINHFVSWVPSGGNSTISLVEADFTKAEFDVLVIPVDDKLCGESILKRDGIIENYGSLLDKGVTESLQIGVCEYFENCKVFACKTLVLIPSYRVCTSNQKQSLEIMAAKNFKKVISEVCSNSFLKNQRRIGFAMPTFSQRFCKNVASAFSSAVTLSTENKEEAYLYICTQEEAESVIEVVDKEISEVLVTKHTRRMVTSAYKGLFTIPATSVKVENKSIFDVKAQCLVVLTSKDLNLDQGTLSKMVLEEGGAGLEKEIRDRCMKTLGNGQFITTSPGNLQSKGVKRLIFGHLTKWSNRKERLKVLQQFVEDCLIEADEQDCKSIAFPALGTGNLRYPPRDVAAAMLDGIESYIEESMSGKVKNVYISTTDDAMYQILDMEQKIRDDQNTRGDGDIANDAEILTSNDSRINYTVVMERYLQTNPSGKFVKVKLMPEIEAGSIDCPTQWLLLIGCGTSMKDLKNAVLDMVNHCEKMLITSVHVYCSNEIPLSFGDQSVAIIDEVFKNITADKYPDRIYNYLSNVTIVVDDEDGFSNIETRLSQKSFFTSIFGAPREWRKETQSRPQSSIRIKLVGEQVKDVKAVKKAIEDFIFRSDLQQPNVAKQMTVKDEKNQHFTSESKSGLKSKFMKDAKQNKITEVNDDGSDMTQETEDTEIEIEGEKKTPETEELLQKDDTVKPDSSSHSSESIVETISCEDLDEQIREWENSSTSSMTSITHIPDDKEKNIKLDTVSEEIGVCPLQGTDCVSGRTVDNAAYIPETQIARGEEENKVPETLNFSIEKVGNRYLLKCNNLVVKIPQLEGASGVSVWEDIILIDNEPIYYIKIDNGKVKISKIGDAECEINRSDNSTNYSGNNESGLYVASQQPQNVEEESDMKKVRGATPDMQNVLNPPQENETKPLNHQDTVADVKHTGSFDADVMKEGGKTAFDITREQQQSLDEAVSKEEKPPIPAPRSKNKDAEKFENMSKSELTFKGYDGKKAKDLQPEDKDELKKIHVNVDEVSGKIETLTTYQLKYAKTILAKYDEEDNTQEGINDNELVAIDNNIEMEATEDVWNIVREICKKDIISFEKKCRPVKFENSKIVIPAHDSDVAKSEVHKLTISIQEMMNKEISEILIDSERVMKPDVPGFCKRVEESLGYECCVWNQDKNKVYAYDDTYDKVMKVKHHFNITSGQIKHTGQNRRKNRGAVNTQSNNDTASDEIKSDIRFEHSFRKTSAYHSDKEQCYKFGNTLVKVYRGDILNLTVDCIVNAANKHLSHGAGVAAVIARTAGYSLTKEGDDYIAQHGDIPVGHAIATTAGNLHYKCVINTVGPNWYDYGRHSRDDVQRCKDDLFNAIYNCFTIAEGMELRSIAFPAISSDLFGVPMEICVEQYARATISYCKKAVGKPNTLSEIHFIDIKPETVKRIQEAFQAKQREGASVEITRGADSESFRATSLKTTESFGATSLKTAVSKSSQKLPEPLAYEEGWKRNAFCFIESEKLNIYCVQDIFSVKANGIVVSVNEKGKFGAIGQAILNKIPKSYLPSFNGDFERKASKGTKTGDVIVNGGYSCGYPAVLLVVYPYEARRKPQDERQADLERAYKNVLLAARDQQIHTVVTTLFGIESNIDKEVKFAANGFLESYLEYCKQKLIEKKSFQQEVTIVCQTEHAHSLVCEVFMKYVQDQKDKEMDKKKLRIPSGRNELCL
ncbi:uncharacterized protein LOC132720172 [Ruditapes philippinarum]|uniref:uncharacterized protein LOC132720172 n=1 Tax=Ruditapes philippinarum TaxID=129788 RepID=UPI00295BB538|nr:uncharacterized protein LOC132720172 [Ruditapes philippinarum]